MEMICPECGHTEILERLPMRLQTCTECAKEGTDTYLAVPSLERRQPIPGALKTRKALLEKRRLTEHRPAV